MFGMVMMDDFNFWEKDCLTFLMNPSAEIYILKIHKESFIEHTDFLYHTHSQEHKTTR